MSLPSFPTGTNLSREDAINQIISSIAMEELGLSHIINAEGEKLQYVLGTIEGITGPGPTIDEVLKVNESVRAVLQSAAESQMQLRNKLQNALSSSVLTGPTGPTGPEGPARIDVGTVTTLEPNVSATVVDGTPDLISAVLNFGIPRGVTGATGTTGATGSAELTAYGNFVANTTKTIVAAIPAAPVPMDVNLGALPLGMTLVAGIPTVAVAGIYRVEYSVLPTTADADTSLQLLNDSVPVSESDVPLLAENESAGVAIISVAANTPVNIGIAGGGITLTGGRTNALINLIRIA